MILDMTMLALFNASEFFQWFVENANYLFVFIFMTIESSFIPFPSEVVVPPAAYLACTGTDMNFGLVIVFATMGALTGAFINYYLALWIGRPIVYRFANSRIGHACLIDQAKVEKAEAYFEKKGAISTFVGRLIPAVRQLISIPAGLARMNIGVFALFTTLGAGIWNIVLAGLGYWLSLHVSREELFDAIEKYNSYLTYAGYAIGVFCVAYILWNAFKTKKNN
jgi:membrane protein DedA with SNARE-associated domain